jgi:hypothetical protein
MSNYTSGNKAPTLMKQHAVKRGLDNPVHMSHNTGATAVTIKKGSTAYEKGHQAVPSAGNSNVINGRHQKVQVSLPTPYNHRATNTGYMDKDRNNFLK